MLRHSQLPGTASTEALCQRLEELAAACVQQGVLRLAAGLGMSRLCCVLRDLLCYVPSHRIGLLSKWSEPLVAAVQEVAAAGGGGELQAAGCHAALGSWLGKLVGVLVVAKQPGKAVMQVQAARGQSYGAPTAKACILV
jgi:hypothetical protein